MQAWDGETTEYVSRHFTGLDLTGKDLGTKIFDGCTFTGCDLSEVNLAKAKFIDCQFNKCNLSLIKISQARFNDVTFDECKVIGVDWTRAAWPNLALTSPLKFFKCILNDSSFHGLNLRELVMEECKAHDVDFREANLSEANFSYTDLTHSLFGKTDLSGANFEEAAHYNIDIFNNTIKGARFSRGEAVNLLEGLDIELID